jgi:predicted nucleic acid-binding protein
MAEGDAVGRPRSSADMVIAAVAEANDCVIVTDNERDFEGLDYVNPMRAAGSRR